jgi:hypothetical protein
LARFPNPKPTTSLWLQTELYSKGAVPVLSKEEEVDLRNMILAMVDEPLVLVVKLADRLHNMRTVYALPPDRQRAVAIETLQVWCSLSERLGMFALKVRALPSPGPCPLCVAVLSHYLSIRRTDSLCARVTNGVSPFALCAVQSSGFEPRGA